MKPEKEKIAELKQKKRQMQEELDELEGNTVKGNLICAGVFVLLLAGALGILTGMIKMNVGGVASDVLAPLISDVPVLRSILPKEMQQKSPSELAAEEQAKADAQTTEAQMPAATKEPGTAGATAVADAAGTTETTAGMVSGSETAGATPAVTDGSGNTADGSAAGQSDTEAKIQDYVDTYSAMDPVEVAKILENMMPEQGELAAIIFQALSAEQRSGILSGMSTDNAVWLTEQTSPLPKQVKSAEELAAEQNAEQAAQLEQEKLAEEAALQEYVDTYSAMKPQDAAQIFDGIMPDQSDLVARILQKMTTDQRAGILSQMSVDNAAILTVKLAELK